jgi:hypothetical protein
MYRGGSANIFTQGGCDDDLTCIRTMYTSGLLKVMCNTAQSGQVYDVYLIEQRQIDVSLLTLDICRMWYGPRRREERGRRLLY